MDYFHTLDMATEDIIVHIGSCGYVGIGSHGGYGSKGGSRYRRTALG